MNLSRKIKRTKQLKIAKQARKDWKAKLYQARLVRAKKLLENIPIPEWATQMPARVAAKTRKKLPTAKEIRITIANKKFNLNAMTRRQKSALISASATPHPLPILELTHDYI